MVKFLAMQVRLRKITIEQVLEKYRDDVRELEQDGVTTGTNDETYFTEV